MLCSAKKTPKLLIYQTLSLAKAALLSMASLVPAVIVDNSIALVLSFLPNTTYDLPASGLPLGSTQSPMQVMSTAMA
jgi:hypothetical protein